MKTTILSLLFIGSSFALFAQTDTTRKDTTGSDSDSVNTIRSTGSYGAYGSVAVPSTVQSTFMSQYPGAGNAMWDRDTASNMWRARYNANSRNISVYMDERGNAYTLALPLVQSLVSEDVVSSAVNKFGNNVYDVLQLKTGDSQYVYQVRLIENGQVRAVHMNEDGSEAVYTPVVHPDPMDSAANMNNSNSNWNTEKADTSGNWNQGDNNINNNNSGNMPDSSNIQNNNIQDNTTEPGNSTNLNNNGTNNLDNQTQPTETGTPGNSSTDQGTDNTNNNTGTGTENNTNIESGTNSNTETSPATNP
jgi:hypothetical protein